MTIISKEPGLTVNGQLTSSLLYFPKNRHISPYFADLGMKTRNIALYLVHRLNCQHNTYRFAVP
jgi:hypothetical protein